MSGVSSPKSTSIDDSNYHLAMQAYRLQSAVVRAPNREDLRQAVLDLNSKVMSATQSRLKNLATTALLQAMQIINGETLELPTIYPVEYDCVESLKQGMALLEYEVYLGATKTTISNEYDQLQSAVHSFQTKKLTSEELSRFKSRLTLTLALANENEISTKQLKNRVELACTPDHLLKMAAAIGVIILLVNRFGATMEYIRVNVPWPCLPCLLPTCDSISALPGRIFNTTRSWLGW